MKIPLPSLMQAYATDDVFCAKTAGERPLASRISDLAMGRALLYNSAHTQETKHVAQAELMNTVFRVLELARLESAIDNAGHTPAPMILPHDYDMPVGMTEGMVRMASVSGATLAKLAAEGPYRTPAEPPPAPAPGPVRGFLARAGIDSGKGLKRTALQLGGTALVVGGGLAALHKGLGVLSSAPHTPSYNTGGNQLSSDVNEYGQTQGRLPTYR